MYGVYYTMAKLEIKVIKGKKYLYLKDKVKVNGKTATVTFYAGRLSKITQDRFAEKLNEFESIKAF